MVKVDDKTVMDEGQIFVFGEQTVEVEWCGDADSEAPFSRVRREIMSEEWVVQEDMANGENVSIYTILPADHNTNYRGSICRLQSSEHIGGITMAENKAHAYRIAAVNDMYYALTGLIAAINSKAEDACDMVGHYESVALKALNKAEGKS